MLLSFAFEIKAQHSWLLTGVYMNDILVVVVVFVWQGARRDMRQQERKKITIRYKLQWAFTLSFIHKQPLLQ